MNISEHTTAFEQEMKRRNFGQQTIENYLSCIKKFFGQSTKDHPKNINETDIRNFLSTFDEPNTQRAYHSATHMVEKGIDINLIQKLLGHSSVKTTNIYTHISHNLISKISSPLNEIKL